MKELRRIILWLIRYNIENDDIRKDYWTLCLIKMRLKSQISNTIKYDVQRSEP